MAVATVFFSFGAVIGLWGGSVAEVSRVASISPDVIGSAFVGYGVAGIVGMAIAGRIGRSVSLKARLIVLLGLTAACLAALFQVTTAAQLIVGLFAFSFLNASVDLVMNSEGLAVEQERGFPVLAGFHGLASLGVGAGAVTGSYISVTLGLPATALACVAVFAIAIYAVAKGTPNRGATHSRESGSSWFRPSTVLIGLGLIVGASIAGELAATMFSAQTMANQAPHLAAYAGFGATAFALCQSAVRMCGDRLRAAFGDSILIRLSLATATAGFLLVAMSTSFPVSALGFAIVGIGTACIVPCGFAMAVKTSTMPAAAVISMLAIITGLVRIPAPLAYGALADRIGFAPAYGVYALLTAGALAAAVIAMGKVRIRRLA